MPLGVFKSLNFDLGKVVVDTTSLESPKNLNSGENGAKAKQGQHSPQGVLDSSCLPSWLPPYFKGTCP